MFRRSAAKAALAICGLLAAATPLAAGAGEPFPRPAIRVTPQEYTCLRAASPPVLDGKLDEKCWDGAAWTAEFVDIEGDLRPAPRFATRVKMLWDDEFFYVAAQMEEPHVWATLTERDVVIFHDNDFEIFIDPDGDNHQYYELEVNALGTEWDLLLIKPYRDGGPAVDAWDIQGLRTAVHVDGTLNDPTDTDRGWSLEIALPWAVLAECAHRPAPPDSGDVWRVNFSRVEWRTEVREGRYVKLTDPETGRPLPEDNWVWSPQGLINMHYPEMWGRVRFLRRTEPPRFAGFGISTEPGARMALMQVYYCQKTWRAEHGRFAATLDQLRQDAPDLLQNVRISTTRDGFQASCRLGRYGTPYLHVNEEGRLWKTPGIPKD